MVIVIHRLGLKNKFVGHEWMGTCIRQYSTLYLAQLFCLKKDVAQLQDCLNQCTISDMQKVQDVLCIQKCIE